MTTIKDGSVKNIERNMTELSTKLLKIAYYLNRLDIRQFTQTDLDQLSGNIIKAEKHCKEIENLVGMYDLQR